MAAVHGTPSLVVQTAIWRRDRGGCGTLIPTPPMVFELATLCASPETFARSYLRERFRRPLSTSLDVPVVHDGKTLVSHGPPSSWAPGVAQRVQTGALQLGVVRVRLAADDAESKDRPISLSALSSAPPPAARQSTFPLASRLASGRLKVGVHAHPGGLDYMEDENVVHTTADFAFFCVYDGHGGTHAAQFCRDRLHFNIMASPAFNAGDAPTALLEGFAKTEADLLLEQARVRVRVRVRVTVRVRVRDRVRVKVRLAVERLCARQQVGATLDRLLAATPFGDDRVHLAGRRALVVRQLRGVHARCMRGACAVQVRCR